MNKSLIRIMIASNGVAGFRRRKCYLMGCMVELINYRRLRVMGRVRRIIDWRGLGGSLNGKGNLLFFCWVYDYFGGLEFRVESSVSNLFVENFLDIFLQLSIPTHYTCIQ